MPTSVRKCSLLLLFCLLSPFFSYGSQKGDTLAVRVMERMVSHFASDTVGVESLAASLYVRENVEAERKNLFLNLFPDMTRFDKGKNDYLAELFYSVHYVQGTLPKIKRVASLSTFGRSSGEMDKVLSFMTPQLSGERLFNAEQLSPLYPSNLRYYKYSIDTTSVDCGRLKIDFITRFDNIQLLTSGYVLVDTVSLLPLKFCAEGWDEHCSFAVEYRMGADGLERMVVDDVSLEMDYSFLGNRLKIRALGSFDYEALQAKSDVTRLERVYDMTGQEPLPNGDELPLHEYAARYRQVPLTAADSLLYATNEILVDSLLRASLDEGRIKRLLWRVGDEAISSHSLSWGSSDIKVAPIINPSYLSYSSSRGLAYKFSLNFRSRFSAKYILELKPMLGYSFKRKEFYWGVKGGVTIAPSRRAAFLFDIGHESSKYNSLELEHIKGWSLDSIDFGAAPFVYYRDFHIKGNFLVEPFNGLELQVGANYYRRRMSGNSVGLEVDGVLLENCYRQFAPHLRVTWHPGMYYYYAAGRKVNLGSLAPRFTLDAEQGVRGIFGSNGVYTRAELDVNCKRRLSSSASLYMRFGAGGYFHTDDIYFVDYQFLKDNYLPRDKDEDPGAELQLLDGEWYSSANKYLRAGVTYESPFLLLQKLIPSARFIKNEALSGNMLFISHLCPYTEYGYTVETPYLNVGIFMGFENLAFHGVGYRLSFSLFKQ